MVYSALFIAALLAVICLPLVTEVVIRRAAIAQTIGMTAEHARGLDDIRFRSYAAVRASGEHQAIPHNSENMPDG